MHLVFDMGNSRIKAAAVVDQEIVSQWTGTVDGSAQLDDLLAFVERLPAAQTVQQIGISSVVPHNTHQVLDAVTAVIPAECLVIDASIELPFEIRYQTAGTLGSDRIAAAAAAWILHRESDSNCVVSIDAGTTTTYEVVMDDAFLGGAIQAGPRVVAAAMASQTAQLPHVDMDRLELPPAVGRSTHEAIHSGILYGYIDAVIGMIERIAREVGRRPSVVVTGGWAGWLEPHLAFPHHLDPHLVLRGVDLLLRLNTR